MIICKDCGHKSKNILEHQNHKCKKEDKYTEEKLKPIIEDIQAVWKLKDDDEWIQALKETLKNLLNSVYDDGFQDGANEGQTEETPDTSFKEGQMESRG